MFDDETWIKMDELHRIAYYYLQVSRGLTELPGYIQVRYDELVDHPKNTATKLANKLGLSFGEKTEEILKTVSKTSKPRDINILNKLTPKIRSQVDYFSDFIENE